MSDELTQSDQDLAEALRRYVADASLDRPVGDVVADVVGVRRRRIPARPRVLALAAAAALALIVVAIVALPHLGLLPSVSNTPADATPSTTAELIKPTQTADLSPPALTTPAPTADRPPPGGRLTTIDGVALSNDRTVVTLSFIGGPPYDPAEPCSVDYTASADLVGAELHVAVWEVEHVARLPLPPGFGCPAVGYNRELEVMLAEPFTGYLVRDLAGYVHFLSRPEGLVEIAVPPRWHLSSEDTLGGSPTGRWRRVYAPRDPAPGASQNRLELIQAFNGDASVSGDQPGPATVNGEPAILYRSESTGELVLVWRLGPHGLALVAYEADFPPDVLIEIAESARLPGIAPPTPGDPSLPAWTPPPGPTMLPIDTRPPRYVNSRDIGRIAVEVMNRLFAAYRAGGTSLGEVFTPVGLAQALENDDMLAAIASGDRTVHLEHEVVFTSEMDGTRYLPDGTPVWIALETIIDVAPGAQVLDGSGELVSEIEEAQRLHFEVTAAWDSAGDRWQIDALRSPALGVQGDVPQGPAEDAAPCPWRADELPPVTGFDPHVTRPWCDGRGRIVSGDYVSLLGEGPAHCDWQSVSMLHLGTPPGWEIDPYTVAQFVRDPEEIFRPRWRPWYGVVPHVPADAVDTGLTNGNVRLFYSPAEYEDAIYAVIGDTVERWPRLRGAAACV